MEDLSGKELGHYRIISPFGEGGMAAVYKAFQPGTERYVALKILPRHYSNDPVFRERFQQEAQIIAKFQHPHILPVFDYGEEDGYAYLAMPLIEGGNLENRLRGQPLNLPQVRGITSQIGDALDYAHAYGVVHRDVKPSNILIDERHNALLSDFGIAKIVGDMANITGTGQTVGTPAYMSPEQIKGEELDGRSDIYSLGIVLYEMVTGRTPFRAQTPPALYVKHLLDPLPPPSSLRPDIPESVEKVILKALAKDPDDRYASVAEMVEGIENATDLDSQRTMNAPVVFPPGMVGDIEENVLEDAPEMPDPVTVDEEASGGNRRFVLWAALFVAAIIAAVFITRAFLLRDPAPDVVEGGAARAVLPADPASETEVWAATPAVITAGQEAAESNRTPAPASREVQFVESDQVLGENANNAVAVGDLDGDGFLDALLNNQIWLNDGAGQFTTKTQDAAFDARKKEIALGDVDGDGDLDLIAAMDGPNEIWFNDGRAAFTGAGQRLGGAESWAVALGDVDGDGDEDALFTNQDGHRLYLNNAAGLFEDSGQDLGSSGWRAAALEDMDGDSDLDAFFADCALYLNDGDGKFTLAEGSSCNQADPVTLAVGDVDGDRDVDAIIGNATLNGNLVMINDGQGGFSSGQPLGASSTEQVVLSDVDRDGDLDIYSANSSEGGGDPANKVWLNDGRGSFSDSGQRIGANSSHGVAAGDLDGDGDPDMLTGSVDGPNKLHLNMILPAVSDSADGLITHWRFDEGSGSQAADTAPAGHENDGSLMNNPLWVAGRRGQALSFDPDLVQSVSTLNNQESLSIPAGEISISAWIKLDTVFGEQVIVAKDKEAYSSRGNYNFAVSNGHLQFGFQPQPSGEDVWIDTAARVLDSHEWTFVAVTFTFAGNEKPRIYANGLEAPLGEWQGSGDQADLPFTYSDPLYIGKSSSDGLFFDGIIDEVKIYNRVLTQEEIAAEGS